MNTINAIKVGSTVNIAINGKLYKKTCGSKEEANELFKTILKAKADPTDENVKMVRTLFNEKHRAILVPGFEFDPEIGEAFMKGFSTPIPNTLLEVIKEYHENNYPMESISNFWKLLMLNPDKRVRTDLFDFIQKHDFALTDYGYMVVYKAVYLKNFVSDEDKEFGRFVNSQYHKIKDDWKTNPRRYIAYKDLSTDEYKITKEKTAEHWNEHEKNIEILGNVADLYLSLFEVDNLDDLKIPFLFTDMFSQSMSIKLGEPVRKERKMCDADPKKDCSSGLHVGATEYVERYAGWHDTEKTRVLVCLVNPMNVVAVPESDTSKIRVSEYFPFALAEYVDEKINIIDEAYFESDYINYDEQTLADLLDKAEAEEEPFETAENGEEEDRPLEELKKIIASRLVDIA